MKKLTLGAEWENVTKVIDFVDRELDQLGCTLSTKIQINIAIDELYSNIARYTYDEVNGEVSVVIENESNPCAVSITFRDKAGLLIHWRVKLLISLSQPENAKSAGLEFIWSGRAWTMSGTNTGMVKTS